MTFSELQHDWNLSPQDAVKLQQELRHKVLLQPLDRDIKLVAGADISFNKFQMKEKLCHKRPDTVAQFIFDEIIPIKPL